MSATSGACLVLNLMVVAATVAGDKIYRGARMRLRLLRAVAPGGGWGSTSQKLRQSRVVTHVYL